jgi:hypothetical protein
VTNICLKDPVYALSIDGEICFDAPLLVDMYHSEAVQRLANIYQGGITAFLKPARNTTRLEHSTGVMTLLRILGAGVTEQAAGLMHDVAHTAFSHVVDFVFPNRDHVYHEVHARDIIKDSDLPNILSRYDLDWRWMVNTENFPLLERPLPKLCADRLDYFLRDGLSLNVITPAEVATLLSHLKVWHNQIVISGASAAVGENSSCPIEVARWLGESFIKMDQLVWCSVQEVGWYAVMARALRAALDHSVIQETDFRRTDHVIMTQLQSCDIPEVHQWLDLLHPTLDFVRDDRQPDIVVLPKVRAVDPQVLVNGQMFPLSELDETFARRREAYVTGKQGVWGLRFKETNEL